MSNSVLDYALKAKNQTLKSLTTIERLKVKGNCFYLGFYSSILSMS